MQRRWLVEYVIVMLLVGVLVIGALSLLGADTGSVITTINDRLIYP